MSFSSPKHQLIPSPHAKKKQIFYTRGLAPAIDTFKFLIKHILRQTCLIFRPPTVVMKASLMPWLNAFFLLWSCIELVCLGT